jgi:hypothetical protein
MVKPSGWLIVFLRQKAKPVKEKGGECSRWKKELCIQVKGPVEEKTTDTSNLKIPSTTSRGTT